jgi:hypothetical protein
MKPNFFARFRQTIKNAVSQLSRLSRVLQAFSYKMSLALL